MLTSICVTELKLTLLTRLHLGEGGGKNPEEDILSGVGGGGPTGWSLAPGGYSCQEYTGYSCHSRRFFHPSSPHQLQLGGVGVRPSPAELGGSVGDPLCAEGAMGAEKSIPRGQVLLACFNFLLASFNSCF